MLQANTSLITDQNVNVIKKIKILAYEPAFGIIGDPAKKDPKTRQSADHSMAYIISTVLRKALEIGTAEWEKVMLSPYDYSSEAVYHPTTRKFMVRVLNMRT